jgi:hypothetical protein
MSALGAVSKVATALAAESSSLSIQEGLASRLAVALVPALLLTYLVWDSSLEVGSDCLQIDSRCFHYSSNRLFC